MECLWHVFLQAGDIYLDGKPASSFSRGEWSKAVALVSQVSLFSLHVCCTVIAWFLWVRHEPT